VSEAPYVLEGLLPHVHQTDLRITEHYTDTAGATDHVFGLCHRLGFRFAPRIKTLKKRKLCTIEKPSTYPLLEPLIGESSMTTAKPSARYGAISGPRALLLTLARTWEIGLARLPLEDLLVLIGIIVQQGRRRAEPVRATLDEASWNSTSACRLRQARDEPGSCGNRPAYHSMINPRSGPALHRACLHQSPRPGKGPSEFCVRCSRKRT
jgi:hypothetical protein